jgi:phospholipase/carboxylesterase
MRDVFELSGPVQKPQSGGKPKQLVVLLHGYGSDGNDLIGLAPPWAPLLPDAEFVAPNAPFPCEMAPFGHQWFSLGDDSPAARLAGVRAAATLLDAYIDAALAARGLDDSKLAMVGFSQGTMMSLFVAPRRAKAPAAVVGYSGALIGPQELASEIRSRPPILLIHGDADPMIPAEALFMSAGALGHAGASVQWHISGGVGHAIDQAGLSMGGMFLAMAFRGMLNRPAEISCPLD